MTPLNDKNASSGQDGSAETGPNRHASGDTSTEAINALITRTRRIHERGDAPAAAVLLPRLLARVGDSPAAEHAINNLKHAIARERIDPQILAKLIDAEMASSEPAYVALKLLQGNIIGAGEYIDIVDELTALARAGSNRPVSLLHVLENRAHVEPKKALVFLSRDSSVPLLPLAQFQPQKKAYSLLPGDYMTLRGAIPFDTLENDLLVAVLNPYDTDLQAEIAKTTGRKCEFFLVSASAYDQTLSLIR